jgi:uncharacterized phiE125 gp8 family phage protein
MALELITDASIEPITYQQVIDHLKINPYDEEIDEGSISYIETLITAVRGDVESFLNRALITQTWKYYLNEWPNRDYIEIPKPPLQSITSVTVLTADAVSAVLDPIYYLVDTVSNRGRMILAEDESWPTNTLYPMNPIQIEFVCGYGDLAEDVPKRIIQALLIGVADLYENRESVIVGQPTGVIKLDTIEKLLWPFKIWI